MANVLHPHIDFHPRPVSHAPSPFGFGFGLGPPSSSSMKASTGWGSSTPGHTNPAAFQQLASYATQSASMRPQKRRMSSEEASENGRYSTASTSRDESMDRSPEPERPKRAAPKRPRVVNLTNPESKSDPSTKENDGPEDVDIGVLLASLPPQSLLPLMLSLVKEQPSLKNTILPLIPRPTLETALQALSQSAKKLGDAYPYSNTPVETQGNSIFGHPSQAPQSNMRSEYILSRLQPHIADYISTCMSYLPYFSCISSPTHNPTPGNTTNQPQTLYKDKFHPNETFLFLRAVTTNIPNLPPLAQTELLKAIYPRLSEEWKTWVIKMDDLVNGQSRIFGSDMLNSWVGELDSLAESRKNAEIASMMREVRDNWVAKIGWLLNRYPPHAMDEL